MHPGPVNRGVELSGEVVDSPQAVITMQVEAGVVVRMAVLYEVLAGRANGPAPTGSRDRHEREPPPRPASALVQAPPRPPSVLIAAAHVLDPRAGIDARTTSSSATANRGDRRARQLAAPPGAEVVDGRGPPPLPPSSTRTSTCACPARSTRRTSRPAPAPPRRAATAPSWRCRTPTPSSTRAPVLRSLRDAAARDARVAVGFMPAITAASGAAS